MKPTDAEPDLAFDRFIARGLAAQTDASGVACPDADLLAAWYDHALSPSEAGRVESHAASCAACQQIMGDLARSEPEVTRAAPPPAPSRPWHWHWRWLAPLATTALVVIVAERTLRAPGETPVTVAARPEQQQETAPAASAEAPKPEGAGAEAPPAGRVAGRVVGGTAKQRVEVAAEKATAAALAPAAPEAAPEAAREAAPARTAAVAQQVAAAPLRSTSAAGPLGATITWRYGAGGVIERSTDHGRTWEPQQSGVTAALADGSAASDRVCWIVGERGVVLRTTDGRTWERLSPPTTADLVSVHAWSESVAAVTAADRSEYDTTDGGRTWRRREPPGPLLP